MAVASRRPPDGSSEGADVRFPDLAVSDLEGKGMTLPNDLPSGPRIVMIAFQRWHTLLLDGWTRVLHPLTAAHPEATVWEVPALSRAYLPGRFWIDGGMRAGIPDPDARRHTLTAYTDLRALARSLDLPSLDTIYVLLLDAEGEIAWRTSGEVTEEKATALAAVVASMGPERRAG
jgi:hypothetical protein